MRVDKTNRKALADAIVKLAEARQNLDNAVEVAKTELEALLTKLNTEIDRFNDMRCEVIGVIEPIADDLRSEWEEKSERWQESDAGVSAGEMVEAWEAVAVETSEIDRVEMLDIDDHLDLSEADDLKEALEQLPEESDS